MRSRPPALVAAAAALALALFAIAACTGGSDKRLIPPPPETKALLTTGPPGSDYTGVALAPVEGRPPAEKVEVLGGESTMSGTISGPDGPVSGATIRLERFVGDAMGVLDIVSNADGTWRAPQPAAPTTIPPTIPGPTVPGQLPTIPPPTAAPTTPPTLPAAGPQGIFGGRYRVRAWRTPDLALTTPQILFLEGKQTRNVSMQLSRYGGITVGSVSSPDPPILDGIVSVTAIVTNLSVDKDGIVRSVALPNAAVQLSVGPGWLFIAGPTLTNATGRATFQLRCQALGQSPVELTVNGAQTFTLPVRACVTPPTTTTSTLLVDPGGSSTSSSVFGGGGTTSTTRGRPSTT